MEIDFYQDYQDLSVPELVKVARSPWDYLPEAVRAAERILRERGVSAEEIGAEEWNLAQKEMSDALPFAMEFFKVSAKYRNVTMFVAVVLGVLEMVAL